MREYVVAFHNDRIGKSGRKNAEPLFLRTTAASLEARVDLVVAAVEAACARLSPTPVQIECGTHRGAVHVGEQPIAAFTIEPPLEMNG